MTTKTPLIPVLAAAAFLLSTGAALACICMGPPNFNQSMCSASECDRRKTEGVGIFANEPEKLPPNIDPATMACTYLTCYSPCLSCSIDYLDPYNDPLDIYTQAPCPAPYAPGVTCYYLNDYQVPLKCGTKQGDASPPCKKEKEEKAKKAATEKAAQLAKRDAAQRKARDQEIVDEANCNAVGYSSSDASCQRLKKKLLAKKKECEKTPEASQCKEVAKQLAKHQKAAKDGQNEQQLLTLGFDQDPPDDGNSDNGNKEEYPDTESYAEDGENSLAGAERDADLIVSNSPSGSKLHRNLPPGAASDEITDPALNIGTIAMGSVETAESGWQRIAQLNNNLGAMKSAHQAAQATQNSGSWWSIFTGIGPKIVSGVATATSSDDTKLLTPVIGGLLMKEHDGT